MFVTRWIVKTYKITEGAAFDSNVATAIKRGAEKGNFNLPKGLAGKVKVSKAVAPAGKEVSNPV